MTNAKEILDKYATEVISKDCVYVDKEGKAGVNSNVSFMYRSGNYSPDICLWKAPNDWIRIEFDGVSLEESKTLVAETVANIKSFEFDYCITYHEGGVSPYINICNLKNIPLNEDNKAAKMLLIEALLPKKAQEKIDRKNLSYTWTPVIGHAHWKPKYKGKLHDVVSGTNPLQQVNEYPKKMLQQLEKAKRNYRNILVHIKQRKKWVEDFLINYCCNHELPAGQRNNIINKNLAILVALRQDKDRIIESYNKYNEGSGSIQGWINSFLRGDIKEVNDKELKKYIIDNNIQYDIEENEPSSIAEYRTEKAIRVFLDKRDLAEQFIKIQPMFYDEGRNYWIWNFADSSWKIVDEVDILNLIQQNSSGNTIESKERNEILEALRQVGRSHTPKHIKKTWIQFKDKFVDIKTKEEFEATAEYFATNPIPYSIGFTKETPVIDMLFKQWVGNDQVVLLKEIMAYCMLPDYPIHRIFCFLGEGRNGKSRYLELIARLIGNDNVAACELDNLMRSRFEMFALYKKLAVQMGETNFSTMSRTAILKSLTGQDRVNFEAKNKNPISDINYAKLLISTNNLPESEDKSDGFYRRWLCIDFPNKFPEGKDILDIIPSEEYNNFCAQAIDLLNKLFETGKFTNEGTVEERQKRYEDRSNPFDKFIKEFCVQYDDEHIFKYDFKKSLDDFCKEHKFRILTDLQIKNNLSKMNIYEGREEKQSWDDQRKEFVTKRIFAWRGIGWKDKGLNKEKIEAIVPKIETIIMDNVENEII
jgi:P4 family phage/plasmid primase-like protien